VRTPTVSDFFDHRNSSVAIAHETWQLVMQGLFTFTFFPESASWWGIIRPVDGLLLRCYSGRNCVRLWRVIWTWGRTSKAGCSFSCSSLDGEIERPHSFHTTRKETASYTSRFSRGLWEYLIHHNEMAHCYLLSYYVLLLLRGGIVQSVPCTAAILWYVLLSYYITY
jgi:hypothetical protein